jgi:endonuclease G
MDVMVRGGTGSAGSATTINNGNITVPSNIWKVLVILPQVPMMLAELQQAFGDCC